MNGIKKSKEPKKCREWEKLRRDKLNKCFAELGKLLPCYSPSVPISKVDTLDKAIVYIGDLRKKLTDVLTEEGIKTTGDDEFKSLCERIKKLLDRNEQLTKLLQTAGIKIPVEGGDILNFKVPLRWSNNITAEEAKKLVEREAQKENKKANSKKKKTVKNDTKKKVPGKHKNAKVGNKKVKKASGVVNVQLSNVVSVSKSLPQLSNRAPPCFIITGNHTLNSVAQSSKNNRAAHTVVINSNSLATPKMASIISPSTGIVPKRSSSFSSLGPGTLILSNGSILPIMPESSTVLSSSTVLTNPTPILLNQPSNNTTLIVMPKNISKKVSLISNVSINKTSLATSAPVNTTPTKTYPRITPKTNLTRVTQVNKVPIPAITSRYSNLLIENSKTAKLEKALPKKTTTRNIDSKSKTAKRKLSDSGDSNKRVKTNLPVSEPQEVKSSVIKESLSETRAINKDDAVALEDTVTKSLNIEPSVVESGTDKEGVVDLGNSGSIVEAEINVSKELLEDASKGGDETELAKENVCVEKRDEKVDEVADKGKEKVKEKVQEEELTKKVNEESVKEVKPTSVQTESCPDKSLPDKTCSLEKENKLVTEVVEEVTKQDVVVSKSVPVTIPVCDPIITKNSMSTGLLEIDTNQDKNLELGLNLHHSELSNDIFSSLQVPIGGQNPESTSPTAAFLLAFPLVSSLTGVKVTEVIEEENSDSRHGTPNLLQIGTMDTTKTTQSVNTESLTPNLLNLDNFSYFSSKDMCSNFYSPFDNSITSNAYPTPLMSNHSDKLLKNSESKNLKVSSESHPKLDPFTTSVDLHISHNTLTTSNPATVGYMSESQIATKNNMLLQNNFARENTSISYSKLTSVSSTYPQETLSTPTQMHYENKLSTTTSSTSCKDANIIHYSSNSRKSDNQYIATSNPATISQLNAFNPFSDFSKSAPFPKSYADPLYTNSAHYNYPQHNSNNFEQNAYYSSTKPSNSKVNHATYGTSNYAESYSMGCKGTPNVKKQRHNTNYYNQTKGPAKDKFVAHPSKVPKVSNQPKPPINWMTSPDFRAQSSNSDYLVPPPFSKEVDYNTNPFYTSNSLAVTTHTSYFNATSTMYTAPDFQTSDNRKFDSNIPLLTNSTQKNEYEENQFAWSPTKLPQFLETPHSFVSSTLPTLVGDLALGTTQAQVDAKPKEVRRSKMHPINYDNQTSFLSVSQLVDSKSTLETSSRTTNRRNTGNRNVKSNSTQKAKHKIDKDLDTQQPFNPKIEKGTKQPQNMNYMQGITEPSNWMPDCNKTNRQNHKNLHSYSAEALIGHQDQSETVAKQRFKQQQTNNYASVNKSIPIPSFLPDNIVPYFTPVDIGQDNNFMQSNPNYQNSSLSHSFPTSVQNNTYPSGSYIPTGPTITSSYLQSSGLLPEFGPHDYGGTMTDNTISHGVMDKKQCSREIKQLPNNNVGRSEDPANLHHQVNSDCSANSSNNFMKKIKQKHPNEGNLPGIVDLGFLSMPSNINSPTLSDDFHSNFLPPPTPSQLFPCKNPLYAKQSSDLNPSSLLHLPPVPVSRNASQHFENPPLGSNGGSSLTSFNLSAIFPEMNKGSAPIPGLYTEPPRSKNYNYQRNYLGSSS